MLSGFKALSADIESDRTIKLHFDRVVTDDDRKELVDAINLQRAFAGAMWQAMDSAPVDGRRIWVSDGKDVWHIVAHTDGSHKNPERATRCKFWMHGHWPAPPTVG